MELRTFYVCEAAGGFCRQLPAMLLQPVPDALL
jgi:hypothetical protein